MRRFQLQVQAQMQGARAEEATAFEDEQPGNVVSLKGWRVRYYQNDHLGTPRELSDEGGAIVWQATITVQVDD